MGAPFISRTGMMPMSCQRVKVSTAEAQKTYALRAPTVEPVFGWIKSNDGLRRWSFRGLERVQVNRIYVIG